METLFDIVKLPVKDPGVVKSFALIPLIVYPTVVPLVMRWVFNVIIKELPSVIETGDYVSSNWGTFGCPKSAWKLPTDIKLSHR